MKPPALFISHGAPTLALDTGATAQFLRDLGRGLGRPRAIVVASAHWETPAPRVTASARPGTIHDFGGFPRELHEMRYPAPGEPALAERIVRDLNAQGFDAAGDPERGIDHGVWVPLSLMFPAADIPVVQLSVQPADDAAHHHALGRALAPLRDEGVLVLGSGSVTHNLRELGAYSDGQAPQWARDFEQWLVDGVSAGQTGELLDFAQRAPAVERNHPTPEHLLPFFVPLGAATPGMAGRALHRDFTYGSLSMAAFRWD